MTRMNFNENINSLLVYLFDVNTCLTIFKASICLSDSPLTINFSDVDKIKLQKPRSALLPSNQQVNLNMTMAPIAKDDININIEGKIFRNINT